MLGILVHESFQLDAVVAVAMLVKEPNIRVQKHHTMKAYEGGRRPGLYLHAFLTWLVDGDGWSAGLPRPPSVWDRTCGRYPFNPYPTAFPYGNGMVLHFYQQQESSMTKTVHKVINKGLKTYV